jgi:hypothetical protein
VAAGIRRRLLPRGRRLVLPKRLRIGEEELRERRVEDADVVQGAGENRPKRVANGALAGEIDDVERARGVAQLAGPDVKTVPAAQRLGECGEILRQGGERVRLPAGALAKVGLPAGALAKVGLPAGALAKVGLPAGALAEVGLPAGALAEVGHRRGVDTEPKPKSVSRL